MSEVTSSRKKSKKQREAAKKTMKHFVVFTLIYAICLM